MSLEVTNGLFAIGGAAVGAFIAGLFTWRAAIVQAGRKLLVCTVGSSENIVQQASAIGLPIEISFAGSKISSLQRADISFLNAGNRAIDNALIQVTIPAHRSLFEIVPSHEANLQNATVRQKRKIGPVLNQSLVILEIDYINPNESFDFAIFYDGPSSEIGVNYRGKDVEFRRSSRTESIEIASNFGELIGYSFPFGAAAVLAGRSIAVWLLPKSWR